MKILILPLLVCLLSSAGFYKFFNENHNLGVANVKTISFQSQGQKLEMAYAYEKPANANGKTILLLHGKNFNGAYWKQTMGYLTARGYAVIAPDQVGFGRSSQPLSYQFSFQQLAENTMLILDSLKIKNVIIIGHSMGGMLATRFALMYPQACSRLILEDPIGLEDWKLSVPYATVDEEIKKEMSKTRQDLKDYMLKNYFHNTWKAEYEPLLDESTQYLSEKQKPIYARNMALTSDMIFTQPVCYEFKDLKVPVVLMIGLEDKTAIGKERADAETAKTLGNYPELGKRTVSQIKDARLLELPGTGHIPHVENFKLFSEKLDIALAD